MALRSLTLTEWCAIITAVSTLVYVIGTFLLWHVSRQTAAVLLKQLRTQSAASHSVAHHSVLDAHRSLFLEVIRDDKLLRIFAGDLAIDVEQARAKFFATLLINHALRIFLDHENGVADSKDVSGYERDARDLFLIDFVQKRWDEVGQYHPEAFRNFVDHKLLSKQTPVARDR